MKIFELLENPSYLPSFMIAFVIVFIFLFKTIRIFFREGTIQHIKDDWRCRLPYRLDTMKFKGLNRPAYTLICLIYYSIKSVFLLVLSVEIYLIKFLFWDIWKWLFQSESRGWDRKLFCSIFSDTYGDEEKNELNLDTDDDHRETNIAHAVPAPLESQSVPNRHEPPLKLQTCGTTAQKICGRWRSIHIGNALTTISTDWKKILRTLMQAMWHLFRFMSFTIFYTNNTILGNLRTSYFYPKIANISKSICSIMK